MTKTDQMFSDQLISGSTDRNRFRGNDKTRNPRLLFLPLFFLAVFVVLSLRIFFLQVIKGYYYRSLSDDNRTKTIAIHAPRGIIFDRNNVPLVFNIPGFREIVKGKTVLVPQDMALSMIANGKQNLEVDTLREYPYKDQTTHVLGYLGQISESELKNPIFSNYKSSDEIGKDGIEQEYESRLKGIDGRELYEIDANGNTIRKLGQDEPIPGDNISLTLDINLQKETYKAMKDVKKGAAVVTTPDGQILALVSKPSFDPNLFTLGKDYKSSTDSGYLSLEQVLLDSSNQPLLNRAIAGVYPPGSTFKLVVASAALKEKVIDENYQIEDTGIIKVGDFSFSNWFFTGYGRTDGSVNVVKGIARSNDIFFYKLAEKTGVDTISKTGSKFGLGAKLGIDLEGESSGVLPTRDWKIKNIGEQWYLGDTYHYGIGQGFVLTTPLQVNAWTEGIANEGKLFRPHLIKKNPEVISSDILDDKSFNLIREGMIEACSPGGVAYPFFNFKVHNSKLKVDGKNILEVPLSSGSADLRQIVVACKTGTAEAPNNENPHAWITLFAPAYNPQIVVTVLSENSGEGSNIAAPIAKKILEEWFSR